MSIESVIPSKHLILCHHLLHLPSIFSWHLGLFQCVSSFWSKYWCFSFSISPSNEYSQLISFRIDWFDILAVQQTEESSPTPYFKSINSSGLSLLYGPAGIPVHDYWKNHSFHQTDFVDKVMSLLFTTLSRFVIAFLPRSKHL